MKNRLRALRFAAGYKSDTDNDIESFAFHYGTTPEKVKMWEAQNGTPNCEFAINLCERLNVPIEFLYGYEFETKRSIDTLAALACDRNEYETLEQDYIKEDTEYQEYIEFKICGGFFKETFDISRHPDAITNTKDIQCAKKYVDASMTFIFI